MDDIISFAQKLSGIGWGAMLFVILYGSYKGIWVWGQDVQKRVDDYEKRLCRSEESSTRWQDIAMRATGLGENAIAIAKQRTKGTVE